MNSRLPLVFVYCIFSFASVITSTCNLVPELSLIDCSSLKLDSVPRFSSTNFVNYRSITLRWNNISFVNITKLKHDLPSIIFVNLRDNPLICSVEVCFSRIIRSDCNCSVIVRNIGATRGKDQIVVPTLKLNATHSNGTISTVTKGMLDSTTEPDSNGAITPSIANNKTTIYQFHATDENKISYEVVIYIVIPCVTVFTFLICFIIVHKKCCRRKKYNRLEQLELEIFEIDRESDDEEEVVYAAKSYRHKSHFE